MRALKLFLAAAFLLAAQRAKAAFEDTGYSPRGVALGGALTAVQDDPVAVFVNPAALGSVRHSQFALDYLRLHDVPAGKVDEEQINGVGAFPINQELMRGAFGLSYLYNQQQGFARERSLGFSYGSRGLIETDDGQGGFDLGGTLKSLSKTYDAGGGVTHIALDLGSIYRFNERYSAGLSFLNLGRPGFNQPDGSKDHAPTTVRLGFAESVHDFTLALDLAKREPSGGQNGAATLGAGLERWWPTARLGGLALRAGLNLGAKEKIGSWGLGWRIMGGELNYAMTIPFNRPHAVGHAVSLAFRFGVSDPEAEYEKVLSGEMRYRKELTASLEAGQVKQWQLGEELTKMRAEMELLRKQLIDKTTSEAEARKRLNEIESRHRDAQQRFDRIQAENKRLADRSQEQLFREDWNAYQKLKGGGAPDTVLTQEIRRMLLQYKDKGVDLSSASAELVRLLRSH